VRDEKTKGFDSLNNLELEALQLYKTLELRLSFQPPPSLSLFPPARIADGAN